MSHPIVDKIVNEGLSSVNVSMLSSQLRCDLLTKAGDTLLHKNRIGEAADAFALGGNDGKLREIGEWFLEQQRYGQAALFLRHIATPDELEKIAKECMRRGETLSAQKIYESLGNQQMVEFIRANFHM